MVSKEIERAIKRVVDATEMVAYANAFGRKNYDELIVKRDEAKAALIALLARDDARIARLENVANEARQAANDFCLYFDDSQTSIWDRLNDALAALDADAPGGG